VPGSSLADLSDYNVVVGRISGPAQEQNSGPGKDDRGTPKPGIREHNRHFSDEPAAPTNVRFQGESSRAAEIPRRQSLTPISDLQGPRQFPSGSQMCPLCNNWIEFK
jgi:hypothetical protein